jgi:hypothetical protein
MHLLNLELEAVFIDEGVEVQVFGENVHVQ